MKVVHLITGLGMGGAERQLFALTQNKAIDHFVICLQDEGELGRQLIDHGVRLTCLNLKKTPLGFLLGLRKLSQILKHEKPDILQTWLYHADLLGLVAGKWVQTPKIVWNVRCSNMDLNRYSQLTAWIVKILKRLSPYPDAVISNSQAGILHHQALGYRPRRWEHIPNGINTEVFFPNKKAGVHLRKDLNIPDNALVIGIIARVDPMKDHATFVKALQVLMKEHENLYCIMAGKDTDRIVWNLPQNRLRCLGTYHNIPSLMNALDIMAITSGFGEGFSNVIGEAMACGVPVISTDVGDAALIVGESHQIVPVGDVDKLIIALNRLLGLSSTERIEINDRSVKRIEKLFSLKVMQDTYHTFYQKLGNPICPLT